MQRSVYRGLEGAGKKSPLKLLAELGRKEILLKITHASLCGTSTFLRQEWHSAARELELLRRLEVASPSSQSEIVLVQATLEMQSCGHCKYCLKGEDVYCYERSAYGEKDHNTGTFGDYYIAIGLETYLHKIPENLPSELAAPLQCAGATTYSAIVQSVKPGDRLGILGIGGLGHLAIQFSAKLGYETIVFSSNASKEAEAKSFGASEFCLLSEPEKIRKPINVLIVTGSKYPEWSKFMEKQILARTATIIPLSAPSTNIELPSVPFFFNGYKLHSSLVASRQIHDDMLAFAAQNHVKPMIEKFELSEKGFAEALAKRILGSLGIEVF